MKRKKKRKNVEKEVQIILKKIVCYNILEKVLSRQEEYQIYRKVYERLGFFGEEAELLTYGSMIALYVYDLPDPDQVILKRYKN